MVIKKYIIKKIGAETGKTVAVFCGVHGNEKAGVYAVTEVLKNIKIKKGIVYFVYANPEAIKKNVRLVRKNLNRCFLKNNRGKTLEDKRARQLMKILDQCDGLLDLHASNVEKATPFVICEKHSYKLAEIFDVGIVSSGWDRIELGATDGYMNKRKGAVSVGIECGYAGESRKNKQLAKKSILQFLQFFGCINQKVNFSKRKQKIIDVIKAIKKKTDDFYFTKKRIDFTPLKAGEIIAYDSGKKYVAGKNECIIFANASKKIGEEAFIVGKNK
ncbi:MAG: succinylglutamate desuccinylase/aspartoacylase family protein [Candidatus Moranbacteria bacterium]|nr:succinylglutamate desuccinylase/aspartoacylase family protein [Candidatus Moranbacteria bacterium]